MQKYDACRIFIYNFITMTITFFHPGKAFLPEIAAYRDFFVKYGVTTRTLSPEAADQPQDPDPDNPPGNSWIMPPAIFRSSARIMRGYDNSRGRRGESIFICDRTSLILHGNPSPGLISVTRTSPDGAGKRRSGIPACWNSFLPEAF